MREVDVVIIGAGPSGCILGALLHKYTNLSMVVVEKELFPRFVIGESLLPFCMNILEEAGFLSAIKKHGFQFKNGAAFSYKEYYRYFDFCDKSSKGHGTTFQVQRSEFDKLLADELCARGIGVLFKHSVQEATFSKEAAEITVRDIEAQKDLRIKARFVVDASGYGRVLPKILRLERPSSLPTRKAYFTHIEDRISEVLYDRNKILITTHPHVQQIWFWLIPFSNGRCSIGVVGEPHLIDIAGLSDEEVLKAHVYEAPLLKRLLNNALWDTHVRSISSYSKDVTTLFGERFLLLGNAGEFLDPIFSSGVSIAMYSAQLASKLIPLILQGQEIDLEHSYTKPLMLGIDTFRTYVEGWYEGVFQRVIYTKIENHDIKRQLCSILAGYAWDTDNPYVLKAKSGLSALGEYCKDSFA